MLQGVELRADRGEELSEEEAEKAAERVRGN
jgi:hypothetical protein